MGFLIILLCGMLSCAKVTIQGSFARRSIKNGNDSIMANCYIFAFTSIMFLILMRDGISVHVISYAVFFGVFSALFQIFYALALKTGPFSISCMLINLSMIIPAVFSIIFFDEKLTLSKLSGFILCLTALFLNTKSDGKEVNSKWFFYVIAALVSTGSLSVVQKIFAKSAYSNELSQFIFLGYFVAFLVTLIVILIQKKKKSEITFKVNKHNILLILGIVLCLGVFQYFNTMANSFIDAIVLNPSVCGLSTMLSSISGRIIFKEKFTRKQLLSIFVGVVAIILISL